MMKNKSWKYFSLKLRIGFEHMNFSAKIYIYVENYLIILNEQIMAKMM